MTSKPDDRETLTEERDALAGKNDPGLWPGLFRQMQAQRDELRARVKALTDALGELLDVSGELIVPDHVEGGQVAWQAIYDRYIAAQRGARAALALSQLPTPPGESR